MDCFTNLLLDKVRKKVYSSILISSVVKRDVLIGINPLTRVHTQIAIKNSVRLLMQDLAAKKKRRGK